MLCLKCLCQQQGFSFSKRLPAVEKLLDGDRDSLIIALEKQVSYSTPSTRLNTKFSSDLSCCLGTKTSGLGVFVFVFLVGGFFVCVCVWRAGFRSEVKNLLIASQSTWAGGTLDHSDHSAFISPWESS